MIPTRQGRRSMWTPAEAESSLSRVDPDILDTARSLFPGAELDVGRVSAGRAAFRFVPGLRHTHMLVPADAPKAAAHAVDRRTAKDSTRLIVRRQLVRTALRAGPLSRALMPHVLRVGPSDNSVLDYLEHVAGAELRFSLAIGARRANRKPVLSVYRVDGTPVGYAKVGLTQLTNDLIDREAATLRALASDPVPTTFRAPVVLHHGGWGASRLLLMSSLQPPQQRSRGRVPLDAMAEVAARSGVHWVTLGESPWLGAVLADGRQLGTTGRPALAGVASRYLELFGDVRIPMGSWHGDLGPWNMAWADRTPLIWDWERAGGDVPVGLDAVHYSCHASLRAIGDIDRTRELLQSVAAQMITPLWARLGLDLAEHRGPRAVLLGYLLTMAARFSVDATRPDGEVVGDLAAWYVTVLRDQLDKEEQAQWS